MSPNGTHGAPMPNKQPIEEGAHPPTESDRISSNAKLIAKLVTERKRVNSLNQDLVKKLQDNASNVTKFRSAITARDRLIANQQIEIAEQKAIVETFKAKIGAKEVSQRAKLIQLGSEHDAAVSILNSQLELKARDVKAHWVQVLNTGQELSATSNMLKKLLSEITKLRADYNGLPTQHCNSKSEASRLRKELTTRRKRVGEQLELMLAHKERIRFHKAKDNNYTKL
jgi:hypothetical protein